MTSHARALLISMGLNMFLACVMVLMATQTGQLASSFSNNIAKPRVAANLSAMRAVRGGLSGPSPRSGATSVAARKFFVGGNWKCNGNRDSITKLIGSLNEGAPVSDVEVVCGAPFPYLDYTRQNLRKDFAVAGQNCWVQGGGAFTGEICAEMLSDIGCDWVILGHSERRHLPEIKETDEVIATKTKYALDKGLGVILCIGELLEEREAGQTLEVCERQMAAVANQVSNWDKVVIAYEPVWAIGTGKVATPEQAQEVHDSVRAWMGKNISPEVAEKTRILYGGSVNADNCDELATKPDIDGFLVGGASLKPDFLKIVDSHKHSLATAA
eukprot:CAMPEP_0197536550 /NCGR_PEP_ID=MMETSP1318-20131121/54167_1 /TAXON_ID=552666 /ORGANISM="Partenskyella glossopodia, Strain RCC365" /LENGTH=327 /DNA_ID=CAMNT_0043094469 /DNA_START=124 /DNA_END=1107 /DNA_ORIENTATION=+